MTLLCLKILFPFFILLTAAKLRIKSLNRRIPKAIDLLSKRIAYKVLLYLLTPGFFLVLPGIDTTLIMTIRCRDSIQDLHDILFLLPLVCSTLRGMRPNIVVPAASIF